MRKIAALSIASVFALGCGTMISQVSYWQDRLPYIYTDHAQTVTALPFIYGGTAFDVAVVVDAATVEANDPGGIMVMLVVDLPFSLVADTVLLPLTIYQQIDRAFWTEERFIQSLSHPDSAVRAHAARWLGLWDETTSEGIVALRGALADPAREVRTEAIVALRELGPKSLSAVPDLLLVIRDDDPRSRAKVAQTLAAIGSDFDSVVSALETLLVDDDRSVREAAARALGLIGSSGNTTIRALSEALHDEEVFVRVAAARSLGKKGPAAAPAIPALITLLKDDDRCARFAAAESLGELGPVARSAEPALRVALNDEVAYVRDAAAEAMTRIRDVGGQGGSEN